MPAVKAPAFVPLDRIAEQPRVVALLRAALETGRIAHAYAFVGAEGSGRGTTALAFAQVLLCERQSGCGNCRGCRMVAGGQHPDLHVIEPTPPATNPKGPRAIRIEAIREIEREASLRPVMAARKVFVIDDADRMTGESPEAFLKTLEEPPDRTVMILVLARTRAVPPTVLSRCQLVRFQRRASAPPAEHAEALALLDQVSASGIERLLLRGDRLEREKAEAMVDGWWIWCRDLLLVKAGAPATLLTNGDRAAQLERASERWSLDGILAAIELCRQARTALQHNVSPRLTVEVVVSRLALAAA
jgi:DNA polymerase-3 subunit delta'